MQAPKRLAALLRAQGGKPAGHGHDGGGAPSLPPRATPYTYLACRLHGLDEKPLYRFLDELEQGAEIDATLERYAALPADFVLAFGGDKFPLPMFAIRGGR